MYKLWCLQKRQDEEIYSVERTAKLTEHRSNIFFFKKSVISDTEKLKRTRGFKIHAFLSSYVLVSVTCQFGKQLFRDGAFILDDS